MRLSLLSPNFTRKPLFPFMRDTLLVLPVLKHDCRRLAFLSCLDSTVIHTSSVRRVCPFFCPFQMYRPFPLYLQTLDSTIEDPDPIRMGNGSWIAYIWNVYRENRNSLMSGYSYLYHVPGTSTVPGGSLMHTVYVFIHMCHTRSTSYAVFIFPSKGSMHLHT